MSLTRQDFDTLVSDQDDAALRNLGGVQGITENLGSHPENGLSTNQVAPLREKFGENRLPAKKRKTCLRHFWDALKDLILMILIVAGVVSIIVGLIVGKDPGDWIQVHVPCNFSQPNPLPSPEPSALFLRALPFCLPCALLRALVPFRTMLKTSALKV